MGRERGSHIPPPLLSPASLSSPVAFTWPTHANSFDLMYKTRWKPATVPIHWDPAFPEIADSVAQINSQKFFPGWGDPDISTVMWTVWLRQKERVVTGTRGYYPCVCGAWPQVHGSDPLCTLKWKQAHLLPIPMCVHMCFHPLTYGRGKLVKTRDVQKQSRFPQAWPAVTQCNTHLNSSTDEFELPPWILMTHSILLSTSFF